jgi:hypothetical protein
MLAAGALGIGLYAGCKLDRLPARSPDRDPSAAEAPVTPYRPLPNALTEELGVETTAPSADPHEGHGDRAPPAKEDDHSGHEGHGEGS